MSAPITDRSRRVLAIARLVALELDDTEITPTHILAALVTEGEGVAAAVLHNFGVDPVALEQGLGTWRGRPPIGQSRRPPESTPPPQSLPHADSTVALLAAADEEQKLLRHGYLGTEHLLLGILRLDGVRAAAVLEAHGVRLEAARAEVARLLGSPIRGF